MDLSHICVTIGQFLFVKNPGPNVLKFPILKVAPFSATWLPCHATTLAVTLAATIAVTRGGQGLIHEAADYPGLNFIQDNFHTYLSEANSGISFW